VYPFSLTLNLEVTPSEKIYAELQSLFERVQTRDSTVTWDRFVLAIADRLSFDSQLADAAKAVAEDYTENGTEE
jgi:hypothetical protein